MGATKAEHGERVEFVNQTDGYAGAVQYAANGDEKSVAIEPGGTVWLSEAEQELTAKAPREAKDNPFLPQPYEIRDPVTDEILEEGHRAVFVVNTEERPIPGARNLRPEAARALGGTDAEEDDSPDGTADEREEVSDPEAQKPAARRRRRAAATSK